MIGSEISGRNDCFRATSVFTSAADGDFAVPAVAVSGSLPGQRTTSDSAVLALRRSKIVSEPWTWLRQVHGDRVVVVESPGQFAGVKADAAVTAVVGAVLCVQTADCAGVLFEGVRTQRSASGSHETCAVAVGAAHAGWRGVAAEILQNTVAELFRLGAERVIWQLGPCISPAAYEFGDAELQALVDRYGESLRSCTAQGQPALDLRAAVSAALGETAAEPRTTERIPCTATEPGYFSWRARQDAERQTAAIWMTAKNKPLVEESQK